ncbi:MAG TPA: 2Fe-2S iron-sulfur cluster-binding protein [Rectinemataceae bacterium]|nr:2Fe-2S iron-sulfur cluster-binding protein [Rectinemataceae bacterium]
MNIEMTLRKTVGEEVFSLDIDPSSTVLDILETIRKDKKPDLLYRHSCHHGSCGTCGAMINGVARLMCLTRLKDLRTDRLLVEPLAKMTEIEGIAVWPGPLFENLPDTDYLAKTGGGDDGRRLEDCIECGICVAACPVQKPFVGPAALAAIDIERAKHPEHWPAMKEFAASAEGAPACERVFECSRACPQGVAPGRRITNLLSLLK